MCFVFRPRVTGWPLIVLQVVTIATVHQRAVVHRFLEYSAAGRGRILRADVPELRLVRNDRLEPGEGVLDVATFEFQQPPFRAVFWSATASRVLHEAIT